jgi:hypothetical protein
MYTESVTVDLGTIHSHEIRIQQQDEIIQQQITELTIQNSASDNIKRQLNYIQSDILIKDTNRKSNMKTVPFSLPHLPVCCSILFVD